MDLPNAGSHFGSLSDACQIETLLAWMRGRTGAAAQVID
jgi:hypothetical protein